MCWCDRTLETAGSQHGESCLWQRSWGRKPDICKGMIWPQGLPLDFPEHLPPKTRVCLPYCTMLSTLLTFSGKKLIQGFSLLHIKGMFQLKPLWWLSNFPDRFPQTFTICELLIAPQPREAQSLKHLKDTKPFSKELKIILVTGFTVESMTAARPPYS